VISSIPFHRVAVAIPASANINALETLGYAEHICNYVVILDSCFSGKIYAIKGVLITRGILEFSWIEVFGKNTKKP
jgi:hypothetical protein